MDKEKQMVEEIVRKTLKNRFSGPMDALLEKCVEGDEGKGSVYNYNGERLICRGYIGEGSYGKVYMYSTDDNRKRYALKRIPISKTVDKAKRTYTTQKIANEIEIQTEIRNNNIYALPLYQCSKTPTEIRNFDFNTQGDLNVDILTPLGRSCFNLFYEVRHNKTNELEQLCIAYDLFRSLESLKSNAIMHRDIKPGNIVVLITNDNNREVQLLLADFTLSYKLSTQNTYCVTNGMGSPPFIDPNLKFDENNKLISSIKSNRTREELFASDVYCMAMTVLSLLTNPEGPWPKEFDKYWVETDNGWTISENVYVHDFTPSLKKINSETLKDILEKALKVDWKQRPTVEEIVAQIREEIFKWCNH